MSTYPLSFSLNTAAIRKEFPKAKKKGDIEKMVLENTTMHYNNGAPVTGSAISTYQITIKVNDTIDTTVSSSSAPSNDVVLRKSRSGGAITVGGTDATAYFKITFTNEDHEASALATDKVSESDMTFHLAINGPNEIVNETLGLSLADLDISIDPKLEIDPEG